MSSSPTVAPVAPRILVADDDPMLRELLVEILTMHGNEVVAVENGQEAVEEAMRAPYDLCILDVEMPVMTGLEACPIICERAFSRKLPIMFLTGCSDAVTIQKAFDAGAGDFLAKPIQATLLWRRASNLMLLSRISKESETLRELIQIVEPTKGEAVAADAALAAN